MSRVSSLIKSTAGPLLVVSGAMAAATGFNLYLLHTTAIPNVEAIRPVTAQKLQEAIAHQLPTTPEGQAASLLAQSQVDELQMLHTAWLSQVNAQAKATRSQLTAWLVAFVISAIGVVERLRKGADAI